MMSIAVPAKMTHDLSEVAEHNVIVMGLCVKEALVLVDMHAIVDSCDQILADHSCEFAERLAAFGEQRRDEPVGLTVRIGQVEQALVLSDGQVNQRLFDGRVGHLFRLLQDFYPSLDETTGGAAGDVESGVGQLSQATCGNTNVVVGLKPRRPLTWEA